MRKRHGADVVKAWLEPLQLIGPEGELLNMRAQSRFVAEHISKANQRARLRLQQSKDSHGHIIDLVSGKLLLLLYNSAISC